MEDVLTPIGGAKSGGVGGEDPDAGASGDAGVDGGGAEVAKPATEDEEDEHGVMKTTVNGAAVGANELMAPGGRTTSTGAGGGGDEAGAHSSSSSRQPETAPSPAPMTSSSSFTGDSSLPTIQRPTCLPSSQSSSKKELSLWTNDGEMDFTQKAVSVFIHCQLLTIFGHGVEKPQSIDK